MQTSENINNNNNKKTWGTYMNKQIDTEESDK